MPLNSHWKVWEWEEKPEPDQLRGLVCPVSQTLFWFALINAQLEKIKGTTFPFWILIDMPKEIMLRCFPLQVAENKIKLPGQHKLTSDSSNPGSCKHKFYLEY